MNTRLMLPLVGLACLLTASVFAQTPYDQLAEDAKAAFSPLGEEELEAARSELAQSVVEAERFLRSTPNDGADWMAYLKWDGLQKQLAPGASPDVAAARETLRLLGSGAEGLENRPMQRVAEEIEAYAAVAGFAPAPPERQTKSFGLAVDGLTKLLADPAQLRSARGSFAAERRLGLLSGLAPTGRDGGFARRVNSEYGRPNLLVEAQSSLLNQVVARNVNETTPVTDCILGTSIRGTGATCSNVSLSTLPAYDRARLAFHLSGNTRSNTTGVNGPVKIYSVGNTTFNATKVIELNDQSFRVMPASANARTRSQTQGVKKIGGGLGSRLIENIARKRIAQKRHQADAIASSHAEDRIEARLDSQLNAQIRDARRRYDDNLSKPMRRRRATPRSLVQRTTSDSLVVEAVQAEEGQLAAWGEAPAGVPAPLSARLHQTAVNNLLDAYLGGATLRRDSVEEPTKVDVVLPPWLKLKAEPPAPGENFEPWELELRDPRPVSVEFEAGRITAIIHAADMRVEGKSYKNWDLIAVYTPALVDGHWRLLREGDIDVLPTRFDPNSGESLPSGDVGLRNNLAKALNEHDRFPREVKIDPVDLTSRGGNVKFLLMNGMEVSEGWIATGWRAL